MNNLITLTIPRRREIVAINSNCLASTVTFMGSAHTSLGWKCKNCRENALHTIIQKMCYEEIHYIQSICCGSYDKHIKWKKVQPVLYGAIFPLILKI